MKKLIPFIIGSLLVPSVAFAGFFSSLGNLFSGPQSFGAPTSTIVQGLYITGLKNASNPCLVVTASGFVSTSTCGVGGGSFTTSTLAGITNTIWNLLSGTGISITTSSNNITITNVGVTSFNGATGTISFSATGSGITSSTPFSAGYIPLTTSSNSLTNSNVFQSGLNIGIGTNNPQSNLEIRSPSGNITQLALIQSDINGWYLSNMATSGTFILGNGGDGSSAKITITSATTTISNNLDVSGGYLNVGTIFLNNVGLVSHLDGAQRVDFANRTLLSSTNGPAFDWSTLTFKSAGSGNGAILDTTAVGGGDKTFSFPSETGTFVLGSGTLGLIPKWSSTNALTNATDGIDYLSSSTLTASNGVALSTNNLALTGRALTLFNLATTTGNLIVGRTDTTGWYSLGVGTDGKVLTASSTATNGVSWETVSGGSGITSLNGLSGASQTFATGTDTNIQLTIGSTGTTHTFTPIWAGTLADSRIASAATWNAKITTTSLSVGGGLLTYNSTTGVFGNTANYVSSTVAGTGISLSGSVGSVTITNSQPHITSTIIAGGITYNGNAFTFTTSSDTNIGITITSSTGNLLYTPTWIGTLADGRIASAATWNAKQNALTFPLAPASSSAAGATTQITYNNATVPAGDANLTWTSSTQLLTVASSSVTGILKIPNGTAPLVNSAGSIALDTTADQLLGATSTVSAVYGRAIDKWFGVRISSSSAAGTFATGTSIEIPGDRGGFTAYSLYCWTDTATATVAIATSTAYSNYITCGTASAATESLFTSSNVFSAGEKMYIKFGTPIGVPNYVMLSTFRKLTPQ